MFDFIGDCSDPNIFLLFLALLGTTLMFFGWKTAEKRERQLKEMTATCEGLRRDRGRQVQIDVKQSSDGRWRISVGPLVPNQKEDADWISTGDGFATEREACDLAKTYWPTALVIVDIGGKDVT